MSLDTALDNALGNVEVELAYRLGLSINALVRNTADAANVVDSSVLVQNAYNVVLTAPVIRAAVQALEGRNVKPFTEGLMCGIIHPFATGDVLNDTTSNGLTDILKRTQSGQDKLLELPGENETPQLDFAGVRFYQSSTVTQTPTYLGHAGVTALSTYIFGQEAIASISLGSMGQIGDGDARNLKIWMMKSDSPDKADPARVIGGWTSYNVKFTTTLPPDTTMRMRVIQAPSAIS